MLEFHTLRTRTVARELIDESVSDAYLLTQTFADMARFNRLFGGIAPVRDEVLRLQAGNVLDVGCGTGQIARAIVRGARRRKLPVAVTCLDSSAPVLQIAQTRSEKFPELCFVVSDGEALPFAPRFFDIAICTLALHHCEPANAVSLLAELRRVARHVVITDLRRCIGGFIGAYIISRLFSINRLTRNDAPLSVRRAYTREEVIGLARQAGWKAPRVQHTPFFRLLLTDDHV